MAVWCGSSTPRRRWYDGVVVRRCVLPVSNGDVGEEGRKVNVGGKSENENIRILYIFRALLGNFRASFSK